MALASNDLSLQHCIEMYAFSPPKLSCNRSFHQSKRRNGSYTLGTFSMHNDHRSSSDQLKIPTGSKSGIISTSPLHGKTDSYNNTIGVIGGVSVFSTLIFLEKLVWWSSRHGKDCVPFIVCSDPCLSREFHHQNVVSSFYEPKYQYETEQLGTANNVIIENLRRKREFLERSGARCIVMPCHLSHSWYKEISQGCSLPFLHLGDCVAKELKSGNLKPLEIDNKIRVGLISTHAIIQAGFYQEKLQKQGFEVLLPDRATMEHIIPPAIAALSRKDVEGGQQLLRIAISILLMKGANRIIIASDKLQGLLPNDDPLFKKCIDPNDALARGRGVQKLKHRVEMRLRSKRVFGEKRGRVVPIDTRIPLVVEVDRENMKKRSEVSFLDQGSDKLRANATATRADAIDLFVPIPGVVQVLEYNDAEIRKFFRAEKYIKADEDEVSRALKRRSANYDMDDEDEEWLSSFNTMAGRCVSDETFELVIDAFEKAIYISPGKYKCVPVELCSEEVAAAVYGFWVKKRKRRRAALVGVFEANKRLKTRGRNKKSMM